ncbi:hypothetical protein ABI59_11265 [Acidobacteria bacterium Mor1]|nr:hypothetical protein ABI59_11265 [Acidobacteria bacterium Mor1]
MNHPQARYLLADWRAGHLDPSTAGEVSQHAENCSICRPLVEVYDLVRAPARARTHLAAERLVDIALGRDPLPEEQEHLALCSACNEQIDQVRAAEASRRVPPRRKQRRTRLAATLAAAAALAFTAFLGGRMSQAPTAVVPDSPALTLRELPLLRGAQRAGEAERLPARDGRIEIALAVPIPESQPGDLRVEIAWSMADDSSVHRTYLTIDELRRLSAGSGAILITLPVGDREEGSGHLVLKSISGEETWLDTPVSWHVSSETGGGQE